MGENCCERCHINFDAFDSMEYQVEQAETALKSVTERLAKAQSAIDTALMCLASVEVGDAERILFGAASKVGQKEYLDEVK